MHTQDFVKILQTMPLEEAFCYYLRFLRRQYEPFQVQDWLWVIRQKDQCCFAAALGGSKTKDMIDLYVFYLLRGYDAAWFASLSGQLKQAKKYLKENIFHLKTARNDVSIRGTRKMGYIGPLTDSILGGRYDICFLDEEQVMEPNQEYAYDNILGRMSHSPLHKLVHIGSLNIGSEFVENTHKYPTIKRPWRKCPWLVRAGTIQKLIDEPSYPRWKINLYYEVLEDVPGGSIFPDVVYSEGIPPPPQYGGIDTNSEEGTAVTLTATKGKIFWIVKKRIFDKTQYQQLANFIKSYPFKFTIEMNGQGAILAAVLESNFGVENLTKFHSTKKRKDRKIQSLATCRIVCYHKDVYNDFKRQHYDKNGNIFKYNDCHLFDASWLSYQQFQWYISA